MNSVQVSVAEKISSISPAVQEKVVAILTERELVRRSNAMVQAIDQLSVFDKDMKKLGPDQKSFDEKGVEQSSSFSKSRLDERARLNKKIDRYTNAVNNALDKGNYSDLFNLASDDKKSGGDEGEREAA